MAHFFSLADVAVPKLKHLLFSTVPTHDTDIVLGGELIQSAGQAQSLEDIGIMSDQKFARLVDPSDYVNLVAQNFGGHDRHLRILHEFIEALDQLKPHVFYRSSGGKNVADERK